MVYLELLMTDSVEPSSERYEHRAYLGLPTKSVNINDGRAELTDVGVQYCKTMYGKDLGWDPTYGNYRLVPLTADNICEHRSKAYVKLRGAEEDMRILDEAMPEIMG